MKTIKPVERHMIDFTPAPGLTNNIIQSLNQMPSQLSPQEFGTYIASYVAALAFVMHSSNQTAEIVRLFSITVEDAGKQFEHRKALMEKEQSSILRLNQ